ncbi:hypothetical protein ACQ4M3_21000 [Leptolyngbya sp. AN03gr2]|uniref:hypothetical protein n=1 Tax=unclassified Leptolyngbya TaxID=2650499 RepID=UPI003D31DB42
MWEDEIVNELHRIREEHAREFNYNLDAMFEDWQKKQAVSDRQIIYQPEHPATDQVNDKSS